MTTPTMTPTTTSAPPWIYINGYPGVGKLTVANALARLLPSLLPSESEPAPSARVYNNHLLIDPIGHMVDRNAPEYRPLREELRQFLLHRIATTPSTRPHVWIFTDSQSSDREGTAAGDDYRRAASLRGAPFISVVLSCTAAENERRLVLREGMVANKLLDVEILRSIRQEEDIRRWGDGADLEMEIDVTDMEAEHVARRIAEGVAGFLVSS